MTNGKPQKMQLFHIKLGFSTFSSYTYEVSSQRLQVNGDSQARRLEMKRNYGWLLGTGAHLADLALVLQTLARRDSSRRAVDRPPMSTVCLFIHSDVATPTPEKWIAKLIHA